MNKNMILSLLVTAGFVGAVFAESASSDKVMIKMSGSDKPVERASRTGAPAKMPGQPALPKLAVSLPDRQNSREDYLNKLKEMNPQQYQALVASQKHAQEKNDILKKYREGKISDVQARQALKPLVEKEVNTEAFLKNVDQQISRYQAQIERFKKIKANPSLLVQERLDQYLGSGARSTAGAHGPSAAAQR